MTNFSFFPYCVFLVILPTGKWHAHSSGSCIFEDEYGAINLVSSEMGSGVGTNEQDHQHGERQ